MSAERQSFLPLGPGEAPILDVIRSFFGRGNRRRPREKFSRPACARRGALGRARRGGRRGARIERLTANLWGPHSSKKERACFSACLFVWSVRVRIVCLLFCCVASRIPQKKFGANVQSFQINKSISREAVQKKQVQNARVGNSRRMTAQRGGGRGWIDVNAYFKHQSPTKEVSAAPPGAVRVDPGPGPDEVSPDPGPTPGQPRAP